MRESCKPSTYFHKSLPLKQIMASFECVHMYSLGEELNLSNDESHELQKFVYEKLTTIIVF